MPISHSEMNRRLIALAENRHVRIWRVDADELSTPERVFRAIWELESQVNNGGFHQYFYNSSGELAPCAANALHAVGAAAAATLVSEAMEIVGYDMPWRDERSRQARMTALSSDAAARLHALDQRFFTYPDDLTTLLYRYVCRHRDEIGAPTEFEQA